MYDTIDQAPTFSDGDEFLAKVRGIIHARQRRNTIVGIGSAMVLSVALFISSFTAVQEQQYRNIWEDYLLSELEYEDVGALHETDAEMYLGMLIEDDFDEILAGIYELGLQEDLVFAYGTGGQ